MQRVLRWCAVAGGVAGVVLGGWVLVQADELSNHPGRYFWLFLALLMLHHFEEIVWPGGVQRWLNETIFGSPDPRSPFTDGRAFVNDVVVGWGGFAVAALVGTRVMWLALVPMFVLWFDALFHVSYTVGSDRYAPGTATALFLVTPFAFYAVTTFVDRDLVSYQAVAVAAALGFLADAAFFIVLRRLTSRRTAPRHRAR